MLIQYKKISQMLSVAIVAMGMSTAQADDDRGGKSGKYGGEDRGRPVQPAQLNAKWQKECSSCHIAYSPGLLPAESWRKIMGGLDKHFDTDASLNAQETKEITDFLVNNASNRWSATTSPLRISETAWFKSKHDSHEVSPAVWKNPLVKSPANCQACHTQAERGDFSERNIRMPR
ncbi:MAG: diheme cytochrome c, partial [Gallionella sp.]|nr:diheme cytochrome c [Gallionella sp.]